MKKLIYILVIVVAYAAYERFLIPEVPTSNAQPGPAQMSASNEQWRSGQQVTGSGRLVRTPRAAISVMTAVGLKVRVPLVRFRPGQRILVC